MKIKRLLIFSIILAAIMTVAAADNNGIEEMTTYYDNVVMVKVPAGYFVMGDDSGDTDERPARKVYLDTFWIDKNEVTHDKYEKCVMTEACMPPENRDEVKDKSLPVVGVSWQDALEYCTWAHKRLPTEAEWEKAARGKAGLKYPWGDTLDCAHANYRDCGVDKPMPVGTYPMGRSPYGALEMAGNVYEWTADYYGAEYYRMAPYRNPTGPMAGKYRVVRGGSFTRAGFAMRIADRAAFTPDTRRSDIGFRCAVDVQL